MPNHSVEAVLHAVPTPTRFVLVSDLDHTMVQNEDPTHERLQMFNRLWTVVFAAESLLVFSTGRSPALFCDLWDQAPLLTPNVLICSVGTEIFYRAADGSLHPDLAWRAQLDKGWDRAAVQDIAAGIPELRLQVASEQRQHKLSFHLQRAATSAEDEAVLSRLRSALADAGLAAKVIYSGGVDVDILAHGAGKGRALEFLLQQLREAGAYPTDGVQVNGDSGNDAELFDVPGVRGCVVANAHPELIAYATDARAAGRSSSIHMAVNPCAGGIVEALLAFKQIPDEPPAPATTLRNMIIELGMLQSNALAGDLSLLSEPDATWITPGGELRHILSCTSAPADAAAAGLTWVDTVSMRRVAGSDSTGRTVPAAGPLLEEGTTDLEPGALLLVTYQLWSFKGQARDNQRVRLCSALVRAAVPAAKDGFRLVHLHEAFMSSVHTATAAFAALAAASGEEIA